MTDHFNAIEYAHQLESAGVPAAQAEVHASVLAQVLDSCLSAATDASNLRSELSYKISDVGVRLRVELKELETKLLSEIKDLKTDLSERIDRLESRMNWMFGILVATQLTLFAMVAGLYLR